MSETVLISIDERGVARLTLNRPEVHNAFDDALIAELTKAFQRLADDADVRVIVITANGKSFSAGGDLNWMRRTAAYSFEENLSDAEGLAAMLKALNELPKPTVALVQGAAYGGGVGLIAACDIVAATERAVFCLSEVKLGLIASVISPYVKAAIGESWARRYTMTAEPFDAERACAIGLVHDVVADDAALDAMGEHLIGLLLNNGPAAMAGVKDLIGYLRGCGIDEDVIAETAVRIARVRASDEGREGVTAFLEKRRPSWTGC